MEKVFSIKSNTWDWIDTGTGGIYGLARLAQSGEYIDGIDTGAGGMCGFARTSTLKVLVEPFSHAKFRQGVQIWRGPSQLQRRPSWNHP